MVLAACGGKPSPPPVASRIGPAIAAAFKAADLASAPWRCASPDGPKLADETIKVGAHEWKLAGSTATREGKGPITIGVIADAGGSAPTTLAALGRLRAQLAEVDLVIALGGMGTTKVEIEATLSAIAANAPWPVIAIAGDLESVTAQTAAIAALRARNQVVFDGRLARNLELPGVSITTIPGASSAGRLVAGADGCGYHGDDVTAALGGLTARPGIRILATAEAPRIAVAGEPAGELAITPGTFAEVDVVLHGPVVETPTPARNGTRDGAAMALTPGTSDATTRLPGRHTPSAGVLSVSATTWRWKPILDQN